MNFKTKNEIGARFKLIARKKDGSIARETDWFLNKVLTSGLARMGVGAWINRCCVGSGNSTPLASQTGLDNLIASTTTTLSDVGVGQTETSPIWYGVQRTWRFSEGAAAGNISEVGMGWDNTALWNRALIRDINGNPTTITILSDEFLDVVAEIRVYPIENFSGTFPVLDRLGNTIETRSYVGKAFVPKVGAFNASKVTFMSTTSGGITLHTGSIGADVATAPSGTQTAITSNAATLTYPTATKLRAVYALNLTTANSLHKSIRVGNTIMSDLGGGGHCGYQIEINPAFEKTNLMTVNYTFELEWSEYTGVL